MLRKIIRYSILGTPFCLKYSQIFSPDSILKGFEQKVADQTSDPRIWSTLQIGSKISAGKNPTNTLKLPFLLLEISAQPQKVLGVPPQAIKLDMAGKPIYY